MTRRDKSLNSLLRGNADSNIVFSELVAILKWLGFQERVRGSHHIFSREGVEDILNLQPRNGKAKPYQVKQVRSVITSYGLVEAENHPESES
jgi:hypothetical protein